MEKQQDPSRQNKSRAEQLYQGYLALENECKSEKTKAVLQKAFGGVTQRFGKHLIHLKLFL